MFSTGQWYFAVFFVITFIIVMIFVYKKDLKEMKSQYKGILWILLTFIGCIAILALLKSILKD